MWANSQVRESQDGVWGETPGEEGGPSVREVLLGLYDKLLLCVPSVIFFVFFVAFFFVSILDSMANGFAAGGVHGVVLFVYHPVCIVLWVL